MEQPLGLREVYVAFSSRFSGVDPGNEVEPFEPTVREDDQQFPSQIVDGGRSVNECVKNCCLYIIS